MNKTDLINLVVEDTNYTKAQITDIINAAFNAISYSLQEGKKVKLMDFGTFEVTTRAPRTAINPKTLEKVQVGQRSRVKFKAGKELVELVNQPISDD